MFIVKDSEGCIVRCFTSYIEASTFKAFNNRPDWSIGLLGCSIEKKR